MGFIPSPVETKTFQVTYSLDGEPTYFTVEAYSLYMAVGRALADIGNRWGFSYSKVSSLNVEQLPPI